MAQTTIIDGVYVLQKQIGQGGMAVVYLADCDLTRFDYIPLYAYTQVPADTHTERMKRAADLDKELRKKAMPTPVSRMKKTDVARELERLKGLHHVEAAKVEEVLKTAEVPAKTAKKVKAVQEVEHKKQEEVVKKTKSVKAQTVEVPTTKDAEKPKKAEKPKAEKGSAEMKERMAKLREMRKAKKEQA